MSRSGVTLSPECIQAYQELKISKKHQFLIFKLSDDMKTIEVDDASDSTDWEVFRKKLLKAETKNKAGDPGVGPRYAIYDFKYDLSSGEGSRSKIVFISWSPDNASIMAKMVYASSKDALRRALDGIAFEFQANDYDDIEFSSVLNRVSKGMA